ncbi:MULTISPECIES: hypothetical protein [Bacteria]|jgi:magnesium-transporting ATPase (P-type)|uniref:Uncharacterized protein n=3 Tax=Staphylococcus warneri TaxID=1292 RepID=A0A364USW5_STAWA|nr:MULTISPECIES: hypothetical protein [Staphylococcus]AGC91637.1 hypothetical protein A284_11620 [Staphylococcus warneri SG1]MBJ7886453.1 hypothetical protein [Bacillaceae bacterium HSR45]PAK72993.1 hypothetical protein B8W95_06890 [Staphylococcus pasteuri]COR60250.1 Uncharacterised protein [Streptococcus pneumoniae]SKR58353.1 Uncharacterised protein [Mycobacteroides abscessus subsp. abscessus]HBO6125316.1 hypothetical protein [Pseudomonas aeruginosa]
MDQYQELFNNPSGFIFILFIFYLIASLFFFTLTVFIGLKPVSFKEKILTIVILTTVLTLTLTGLSYVIIS